MVLPHDMSPVTDKFSLMFNVFVEIRLLLVIFSEFIVVKLQVTPVNIFPSKLVKLPVFDVNVPFSKALLFMLTESHSNPAEVFTTKVSNSKSLKVIWSPPNSIPLVQLTYMEYLDLHDDILLASSFF